MRYTKEQIEWLERHIYWRSNELTELFNLRFREHKTLAQIRWKLSQMRRKEK